MRHVLPVSMTYDSITVYWSHPQRLSATCSDLSANSNAFGMAMEVTSRMSFLGAEG
jgi:hypothetical protein